MRTLSLAIALSLVGCGDTSDPTDTTIPDSVAVEIDALDETTPDATETTLEDSAEPDSSPDIAETLEAIDAPNPTDTTDTTDVIDTLDTREVEAEAVIDPNGDTDRDGIFDLEEVDDGTNPFDPRSARAWHPEITHHPRLFTHPDARATIVARAAATDGRAQTLWARVIALADRAMPAHPLDQGYNTDIPFNQGPIVEAAALVGYVTGDLAYTTKALDTLAAAFPDPTPLNNRSMFNAGDHYDLLEAEALQGFCSAYDLAAGTPDVDPTQLAAAAARLVERVDYFRTLCMTRGGCTSLLRNEPNNHAVKALAALGTCAMALPDRASAAADFNEALTAIDFLAHERQGNLEGGWAESWNYLSYSGETHLGFLAAVHNVGVASWSLVGDGWITRSNERNDQLVEVLDPAGDPLWRAVYERALFATMPSGVTPAVDDANPSALHGGLIAALFDDPRFLWNWTLPRVGLHTGRQLVATFLMADPAIAPVTPDWGDGFFAEAGFSILRSGLDVNASYFHMQHEREDMRVMGGAHEHADNLSFLLAAHGTELAIDPGYLDFTNHKKVKYGTDHNIVLVDGLGPEFFLDDQLVEIAPNSDAYLHDHATAPPFTTFIASTKYRDAELRRRVVRVTTPGQDVFIVADDLVNLGAAPTRKWTFQLNGLASEEIGGTSFATTDSASGTFAEWRRPGATLFAAVTANGDATIASRLEESIFSSQRHRCLTVDADMGAGAGFLTVLIPALPDATPVITSTRVGQVVVTNVTLPDGTVLVAYLNPSSEAVIDGKSIVPGLTVMSADQVGHWTLQTPPIPDPTPFIPL